MKLIHKTIVFYLLIGIPLLVLGAVLSYFLIGNELRDGIDENLEREKLNVQKLINGLKEPANTYLGYDSLSYIKIAEESLPEDVYSDTCIHHKRKKDPHNYRMLRSTYYFNGTTYLITITRTVQEEEELMASLFPAFALLMGFLVLSFFMVSWLVSKKLWQPFYNTLEALNHYDLKNHSETNFKPQKITEFNQLNSALNRMTHKIHSDFAQQKEFTENASHEMQTPLAVVRANLSLLMQSPNLKEEEMGHLEAIETTVKKLSSLNKTLILLSKIENNQYHESVELNLAEKVNAALELFFDFIQAKNIHVTMEKKTEPMITLNPVLAEILISNLLQNAIRHNLEGGTIKVSLSAHTLSISNSGLPLSLSEDELFVRFKKNDASKDSLGLGLSIVKSIAGLYGMEIRYSYSDQFHHFILNF